MAGEPHPNLPEVAMRRHVLIGAALGLMCVLALTAKTASQQNAPESANKPQWAMNATIIEACSCPMFCQCYFDTKPAPGDPHGHGHGGHAAAAEPGKAAAAGAAPW